ncbi:adenylate/guanylate cyclase domain-containing protein [Flavilitoribacter nigricans]|uniref:Guanylate cyclase domain-containing protein n=1 Tax=Flavilitoribacter nigricans (strain ATCC 23147 / DSM 23189 / NBRC 102662 / NCIMB 1420 / SS-2) TaxID=1122177 RepID=A0A2D0NJW9_FLAN2|nr:adenylate/guanylate cyclase domain-containing protein [Flavilitoribacter nigricans]PHN08666.1 hypothetical protein CRP01_01780 [Flavilitoribacter nigricans DSM 23189 = NBRC 102662]
MKSSKSFNRKFRTVLWICLGWTLVSVLQLLYELAVLKEYGYSYRWSNADSVMTYFLINTLAFVLNGFIAGLVIVFFLQHWIRDRSYSLGILYGVAVYSSLFFIMTALQNYFVVRSIWDGSGSFFAAYVQGLRDYFFSYEFVRMFPFWLLVLIATLIALLVNDKYGPGVLKNFLLGRYFHPRSEQRIFMFLDLKGSTTIAEKLGEQKYFNFIKRVFRDVTPALLATQGEIYQYVGDEIVITWTVKQGVKKLNCIRCFEQIRKILADKAARYREDFGAIPQFKAGLHVGTAIVGEIGVIKRDIAYSGDVLNTTARIQSLCNEYGETLLLSGEILKLLPTAQLVPKPLGEVVLRGKTKAVELYGL